jgi:PmbA protein
VSLLDLAQSIIDRRQGGDEMEAYLVHEKEVQIKAYQGEVESISSAEPRGAGVRLLRDGRVGFAFTTDLSDAGIDDLVTRARDNSGHSTADEAVALASAWDRPPEDVPGLFDPDQEAIPPDQKVAFALELEEATRTFDPRVRAVEEAVYADSIATVAIATTTGIAGTSQATAAWCYSIAIATEGEDTEVGFDFDLGRGLRELDAHSVGERSATRALSVLGATKIPSARLPVVFEPYTAAQFLGVIASALTGEAVQRGRSLFAGRMGDSVANSRISLVDDGRIPGAPGSSPWDAEGVPSRRTEVIRGGTLVSLLYDTTSARRENRASTGNASRAGFKSMPHPAPTNLTIESTGETREELLARAGHAFVVQDFHGVHSGANPISGDFSVGATGYLLENGERDRPVKEVTIAAPMMDILKGIVAVADDLRWLPFGGSFGGATTLIEEMTIAGS